MMFSIMYTDVYINVVVIKDVNITVAVYMEEKNGKGVFITMFHILCRSLYCCLLPEHCEFAAAGFVFLFCVFSRIICDCRFLLVGERAREKNT